MVNVTWVGIFCCQPAMRNACTVALATMSNISKLLKDSHPRALIAAWAADSLAIGTRNGEHET